MFCLDSRAKVLFQVCVGVELQRFCSLSALQAVIRVAPKLCFQCLFYDACMKLVSSSHVTRQQEVTEHKNGNDHRNKPQKLLQANAACLGEQSVCTATPAHSVSHLLPCLMAAFLLTICCPKHMSSLFSSAQLHQTATC
jgi:hypothetical protein